jgi:signal transduction histidine kinase
MGFATTLEDYDETMPPNERRLCLKAIVRNAQRISSIIDELLLLASVRKEDVSIEPIYMFNVILEARHRVEPMLKERNVELVVPKEWPLALGYAPWIEHVWTNYLNNALRYGAPPTGSGQTPRIELGADAPADGFVRFWVRDNGRGLSAEERGRLFIPFTRLKQVRARGHGLGLSIVRRIVEKLGGAVSVESAGVPGEGCTFSFTLPAA